MLTLAARAVLSSAAQALATDAADVADAAASSRAGASPSPAAASSPHIEGNADTRRRALLAEHDGADTGAAALLQRLVDAGLDVLPLPGHGRTLQRWQALADVAAHDLSLAKLFEGHTDALATLREIDADSADALPRGSLCGLWAAEPPDAKVVMHDDAGRSNAVTLHGRKAWCSGAAALSHALLTVWRDDGSGPLLALVALHQPGVRVTRDGWAAVGMAASASVDVHFDGAVAERIGAAGDYLQRPGFWHGGAGIAACWYGGSVALAAALRRVVRDAGNAGGSAHDVRRAALGKVDVALAQTAAVLREAAAWIDGEPRADANGGANAGANADANADADADAHAGAHAVALRARLSAEHSATLVLHEVGRALGAAPLCRDARLARRAADLPVFIRQSGAERDAVALGACVAHKRDDEPADAVFGAWALRR